MVQYTTVVAAPLKKVWKDLIYKIDHPEHFVPGVSEVIIFDLTISTFKIPCSIFQVKMLKFINFKIQNSLFNIPS